jgi:putative sigma-54 modulation protein
MQVSVTFRHVDATEALKDYARDKVDRVKKYVHNPMEAHVVLSTERYLHIADVTITLPNGLVIKGREGSEDMYSSIDLVMDKIERQVRKYKEKIRQHKPIPEYRDIPPLRETIYQEIQAEGHASVPAGESEENAPSPQIIRTENFFAKPMTIDEAVMQLNLLENDFLVFTNAQSKDVNVIYRRKDGNLGLIETGRSSHGTVS